MPPFSINNKTVVQLGIALFTIGFVVYEAIVFFIFNSYSPWIFLVLGASLMQGLPLFVAHRYPVTVLAVTIFFGLILEIFSKKAVKTVVDRKRA